MTCAKIVTDEDDDGEGGSDGEGIWFWLAACTLLDPHAVTRNGLMGQHNHGKAPAVGRLCSRETKRKQPVAHMMVPTQQNEKRLPKRRIGETRENQSTCDQSDGFYTQK